MQAPPPFLDRGGLLQEVLGRLVASDHGDKGSGSAHYLWGPAGSGKTRFLDACAQRFSEASAAHLVLRLSAVPAAASTTLIEELQACLISGPGQLRASWLQAWQAEDAAPVGAPGAPPDFEGENTPFQGWVEQLGQHPGLRLLLCFDDLDHWPQARIEECWTRLLQPLLRHPRASRSIHTVLTGGSANGADIAFSKGWTALPVHLHKHALPPLKRAEALAWLSSCGLKLPPSATADEALLHWPGPLLSAAHSTTAHEAASTLQHALAPLRQRLDNEAIRALHHATFLEQWCNDGLTVLLRKPVPASLAENLRLELLGHLPGYRGEGTLPEASREPLRAWCKEQLPALQPPEADDVAAMNTLIRHCPVSESRAVFMRFARLLYFNQESLEALLPKQARELWTFVEQHPTLFWQSEDWWQVAPVLEKALLHYAGRLEQDRVLLQRASELWGAQAQTCHEALQAIEAREARLKEQREACETALAEADARLEAASGTCRTLDKHVQRARHPHSAAHRKAARGIHRLVSTVLAEILGVGLLYLSIPFSQEFNTAYFVLGMACVLAGLVFSLSSGTKTHGRAHAAAPAPELTALQARQQRAQQGLKSVSLRQRSLSLRLSEIRRKLGDLQRESSRLQSVLDHAWVRPQQGHMAS